MRERERESSGQGLLVRACSTKFERRGRRDNSRLGEITGAWLVCPFGDDDGDDDGDDGHTSWCPTRALPRRATTSSRALSRGLGLLACLLPGPAVLPAMAPVERVLFGTRGLG